MLYVLAEVLCVETKWDGIDGLDIVAFIESGVS